MTNTLADPGPFDGLAKLRPNEPFFPLMGRDPFAPELVRKWADMQRTHVRTNITDSDHAKVELLKATEADQISWDMDAYRKGERRQEATEQRAEMPANSYTGHILPEETEKRDAEHRARAEAARHLSEAAAEAQLAVELLTDLGLVDEAEAAATARDTLKSAAETTRPRRPIPMQPELAIEKEDGR